MRNGTKPQSNIHFVVATHRILLCVRYKCGVKKKSEFYTQNERDRDKIEHAELNETSSNIRYSKEILWMNVYAFPKEKENYTKS